MRVVYLIVVITILATKGYAQQNDKQALYIQYQRINKTDGYHQWFTRDVTVYSFLHGEIPPVNIPLVIDGKLIYTSDTVVYKEEIKEYIKNETLKARKIKQVDVFRYNNSDIIFYQALKKIKGKNYIVVDTLKKMSEWEIEDDTTTILGYKCQKAVTKFYNTTYIAYFTTDLHFVGGPKNFRGLPGIILKVVTSDGKFGFAATEIQYPYKGELTAMPTKGVKISINEFSKLEEAEKNN
ncbi:MAG: GLPGLI family protein [Chitinophagales bacterium]|nr:GLPGLI family protein [Chitinophagales bacterium]